MYALFLATRKRVGFYWGESNPSFKYHTARADGAPGSGGAVTEGDRRGGVTGARSGRALMLPTKRLPLSRRSEDHLADPGSGAGGDGAGAWMEKKRRAPDNGFPAAHTAPAPWLPSPQAPGGQRFAEPGRTLCVSMSVRVCEPSAGDGRDPPGGPARHTSIPSRPSHRPSGDTLEKQASCGLGHRRFCKHGWSARHPHLRGRGFPRGQRERSLAPPGNSPGRLQPGPPRRQRASGERAAGRPPPGGSAASPAIVSAREPVSPGQRETREETRCCCAKCGPCVGTIYSECNCRHQARGLAEPRGGGEKGYVSLSLLAPPPPHVFPKAKPRRCVCITVRFTDFSLGACWFSFFFFFFSPVQGFPDLLLC
ncbi:translation initiation factor IF-2-like [Falco naumanni]|uniref:translation initiation factor IF-2-like n=1 Tax=Falco naumanni TaxID=148594 RepID=UPI001ADE6BFD|nr:translation initiation factor IF-2-like [Falco naumanni]